MSLPMMIGSSGVTPPVTWVDDVFSAYTYTGNGSTQTITNGIDLAGKGGMVWVKHRDTVASHYVMDTVRGNYGSGAAQASYVLSSNATTAQGTSSASGGPCDLTAYTSSGFSVGPAWNANLNASGKSMVAWTFANAPKFFKVTTVTKSSGSNATVDLSSLGTVGMVKVKCTDSTGSWYVWHRSLSAGKLLIGETTAAEATLGHITVSGTTLTLVNGVIADGTYHVEAYAHDTSADGLIQCGSLTSVGAGATAALGWEPQFITIKRIDSAVSWYMQDSSRGLVTFGANGAHLVPNTSAAEVASSVVTVNAMGFYSGADGTNIYLAIRRPNKPPTSGTQVYNNASQSPANPTTITTAFPVDFIISSQRSNAGGWGNNFADRLRGSSRSSAPYLTSNSTGGEGNLGAYGFDMNPTTIVENFWQALGISTPVVYHFFRRAPGFMDVVCYTGTGAAHTEAHGLGVVPELMIFKLRNAASAWRTWHNSIAITSQLALNEISATDPVGQWNGVLPSSTAFTVTGSLNSSAQTAVAYLFATLAGISKVGSYTGTAATLQINCGFTAGARFILIKRTDATGDWYVWDSVRGIIAGNDPYLLLNSTAAEVTTTDYIDPYAAGFELSSTAPAAINASGGSFIYLAIA